MTFGKFISGVASLAASVCLAAPPTARKECRAGQETLLEVTLRNIGTVPAKGVKATITGLPAGVRLARPEAATNVTVCGEGVVDGHGLPTWRAYWAAAKAGTRLG
mgnify:CR=1 FL=1